MSWAPDGKRIVTASGDGTAQIWDPATGDTLLTYTGHGAPVFAVAWSPDGKHIVTGGQDQTAQVWDPASGVPLLTYTAHQMPGKSADNLPLGTVHTLAWAPDGGRIASAALDGTAHVWRVG